MARVPKEDRRRAEGEGAERHHGEDHSPRERACPKGESRDGEPEGDDKKRAEKLAARREARAQTRQCQPPQARQ